MAKPKKTNSRISDHFSQKEFSCKCGVCDGSTRVSLGLVGGLELLRSRINARINIVKGYRCQDASKKSGSLKKDYHTQGIAADITVDKMDIIELFKVAESIPEFNGIGINFTEKYVHVDTRKIKRELWIVEYGKQQELTAENRSQFLGG